MVLWSTSCSSLDTSVGSAVDSVGEDIILELNVLRDNSSGEVVRSGVDDFEDFVNVIVTIGNDDLEWTKDFSGEDFELLFVVGLDSVDWDLNSSW